MTIAAGAVLFLAAALLRTRYGRLTLALSLLRAGNVLIEAAERAMGPQR
ncbi:MULTISPECIES: hypothetical protein [unclassified Mesorhizobium]|nr:MULTISPECIES: hypothetical protein [unclassified Mesorhizobium]